MSLFRKDEKKDYEVRENGKLFGIWSCTKSEARENKQIAKEMGKARGTNVTIEKK